MRAMVAMAVPDGRVALVVVVQLDDLGGLEERRRQLGEAHHQHRADGEVGGDEAVARRERRRGRRRGRRRRSRWCRRRRGCRARRATGSVSRAAGGDREVDDDVGAGIDEGVEVGSTMASRRRPRRRRGGGRPRRRGGGRGRRDGLADGAAHAAAGADDADRATGHRPAGRHRRRRRGRRRVGDGRRRRRRRCGGRTGGGGRRRPAAAAAGRRRAAARRRPGAAAAPAASAAGSWPSCAELAVLGLVGLELGDEALDVGRRPRPRRARCGRRSTRRRGRGAACRPCGRPGRRRASPCPCRASPWRSAAACRGTPWGRTLQPAGDRSRRGSTSPKLPTMRFERRPRRSSAANASRTTPSAGSLTVGERSVTLTCPEPATTSASCAPTSTWSPSSATSPSNGRCDLRRDDVVVLAELLDLDDVAPRDASSRRSCASRPPRPGRCVASCSATG